MTHKFIALRRTTPPQGNTAGTPVEAVRAARMEIVHDTSVRTELEQAGLTPHDPYVERPDGDNRYASLPYLNAYLVETPDPALAQRARAVLEPEYLIMPNLELALPVSERGRLYQRLPPGAGTWPAESGVELARSLGVNGKGVVVCVLDSGVDADHVELRNKVIDFRYVPLDPQTNPVRECRGFDVNGHGTHVCGIIAGRTIGVAPEVNLLVASVIESETLRTSLERVVVALNWVLARFQNPEYLDKPFIVNMSLGFPQTSLQEDNASAAVLGFQQILNTLVSDFDVLPIVAVGNDGPGALRAPASFSGTLSVGAVNDKLEPATFSGGGASSLTGETEPDIAGFGVDIVSSFERTIRNRSLYRRMSGTSMATPYAAGIAALYASQQPTLQGKALWQRLVKTALPLSAPPDRVGAGLARFIQEENP